jgi:formylglycine-generating enzyme required for sulfatase activity
MVFVEGGSFVMGSGRGGSDERPAHDVVLDDFYIGKYEVTQKLWNAVMNNDYSVQYFEGCDSCPVERITWYNAIEFIEKLNELTEMNYRLPTEAEWEYAARGGRLSMGYKYSGSNIADSVAWTDGNAGNMVHGVGLKKPNELGIYDMSGNVYEWCSDWYSAGYYTVSPNDNPLGPAEGTQKVIRGGSWWFDRSGLRTTEREGGNPEFRYGYVGLRLCRTPY